MLNLDKNDFSGASTMSTDYDSELERMRAFTQEELLDQKRQAQVQTENKDMERSHLEKAVHRKGFIRFSDYTSKLKMMDTALFLFGLKMHKQEGHVKFYDADFLNVVQISSTLFYDRELGDCCRLVNEALSDAGFSGRLFEVGQLREIDDFNLN